MNIKNLLLGPTRAEVKIVGVSNYTETVARLLDGTVVVVEHEPTNKFDTNAMRVCLDGETVGYLPKTIAERIITETPDRVFLAHIDHVTRYENVTVGGVLVFDSVTEGRTPVLAGKSGGQPVAPVVSDDRPVF
jgi:hypothetical protein